MAIYSSLKDKRVLVTGGASGIGADIVMGFCEQQAKLVFFDIDTQHGHALAQQTGALFVACDVTDTDALQAAIARAASEVGAFNVLVNNAAKDDRHEIEDVTPDYWDASMAVNLRHYFFAAQSVVPGMKAAGGGSIVNMGSTASVLGSAELPVYAAAKGACVGLTRSLARKLGEHNIRVNTVLPGWIKTQRQIDNWITPQAEADWMKLQPLKTWVMPRDVANMVVFLASDEARMCTAQTYTVDAGRT